MMNEDVTRFITIAPGRVLKLAWLGEVHIRR
jgi:hypothetical protein